MRRRTAVRRTAALGTVAVAGCMDAPSSPGTPTDAPVSIEGDPSFILHDRSSGDGAESATVVFDAEKPAVTVEGTIVGKNGCMIAALDDATYDPEADELRVTIATRRAADAGDVCTEALQDISYTAGINFDGGVPGTVEVIHQSRGESRTVSTTSSS